jgi:RNA-dependent RNA polymerase
MVVVPLHDPRLGKLPAEKILTDGCGLMNGAALTAIWNSTTVKLPHRPVAVQGRRGGEKGMWTLDPTDQSPTAPPRMYSRPSQNKINLPRPLHRAHLIFDLLAPSRVTMPSHLSTQTINCLSHNGVPDTAFKTLVEKELEAVIQPLTDWDGPGSMLAVAKAIERAGHITGARLQRLAGGSTKALGLSRDFHRDEDDGDRDDHGDVFQSLESQVSSGRESFSDAPRSAFESAYELLLAGFHPLKLKLLYDKMQKIVSYVVDNFVKNLRIPVSESVEAFIIPGEAQFPFSMRSGSNPCQIRRAFWKKARSIFAHHKA